MLIEGSATGVRKTLDRDGSNEGVDLERRRARIRAGALWGSDGTWAFPDVCRGRCAIAPESGSDSGRVATGPVVVAAAFRRANDCRVVRRVHGDGKDALPRDRYDGWGIVVASRFLGRTSLAKALGEFLTEGVWGMSPHLIPHYALHSASGTISLGLGLHGPNLGVGGGLHSGAEGFLAALTWLSIGSVSGVWLVLSGWSPELVPERDKCPPPERECRALAIALCRRGKPGGRGVFQATVVAESDPMAAPIDLVALADGLDSGTESTRRTVATDPIGRLQIALMEGPTGPG